jgi:hypothetical protein
MKAQVGAAGGGPTDSTFTHLACAVHRFEGSLSRHIGNFSQSETLIHQVKL